MNGPRSQDTEEEGREGDREEEERERKRRRGVELAHRPRRSHRQSHGPT